MTMLALYPPSAALRVGCFVWCAQTHRVTAVTTAQEALTLSRTEYLRINLGRSVFADDGTIPPAPRCTV